MRFGSSTSAFALAAVGTVINAASPCQAQCNANNCLRALRNPDVITAARSFCSSFTAVATWTAPLPTYVNPCSASASKISSACSCIATSSTTTGGTSTTSATTTTSATSVPTTTGTTTGGSSSSETTTSATTTTTGPTSSSTSSSGSSISLSSSSSSSGTTSGTSSSTGSSSSSESTSSLTSTSTSSTSVSISSSSSTSSSSSESSTSACNTGAPSTVFVTLPASTTTVTANASTVTVNSYPSAANPGATNLPNPNFEAPIPNPPTDYCKNVANGATCSIVNVSDPGYGPQFQGLFGPGMLRVSASNSEGRLDDFAVDAPIVGTPNPHGRNWVATVYYRPDAGNPHGCWPIIGWYNPTTGYGYGYQPDFDAAYNGDWQMFRKELPDSAAGRPGFGLYITAGCYPGSGWLYVDGVKIT